jgi:hydroxyacylglutathione hydrolase
MLKVKTIAVGLLGTNCYLAIDPETNQGIIIDPGADKEKILGAVNRSGAVFTAVINTHGHFDHIAADIIKTDLGIPLLIHKLEMPRFKSGLADQMMLLGFGPAEEIPEPDRFLEEGDKIKVGNEKLTVWHTPGHTPGGISLLGKGLVFTGDTLFCGGVGRTDLEDGSDADLDRSLERLLRLPGETIVYSGHGPSSVIENERPAI